MQDKQTDTATIECETLTEEKRKYTFNLLDAENGTRLFHQYAPMARSIYDAVTDMIVAFATDTKSNESNEIGITSMRLLEQLPKVLTWEVCLELAKDLLAGHKVEIDGKEYEANERGFTDYKGDPLEMYNAIFNAVRVNYPKYVDPFLQTLFGEVSDELGTTHASDES